MIEILIRFDPATNRLELNSSIIGHGVMFDGILSQAKALAAKIRSQQMGDEKEPQIVIPSPVLNGRLGQG